MTTVIQTLSQSKKIGAVKDIYTQLGMPTVSLFADAYQDVGDGNEINRILACDGLDLVAMTTAHTDIKLKKIDGKNYLNFRGSENTASTNKEPFNTENNLTFVINVKFTVETMDQQPFEHRIFSLGASATERVILHAVAGDLMGLTFGGSARIHTFNADNGFKVGEFNKVAVHFNKTKTIVVCNGVTTELPPYNTPFGGNFVARRGNMEKDLDFIQIFEDTQVHTASELISYLDYISN